MTLSPEEIEQTAKENTPFYSWGKPEWGNILHAIEIGAKAQLAKLASVTDKEMVEMWARELFEVWKEAKSDLPDGDNWNDQTWESLPDKHKEEYLKTARRNLSQLSLITNAQKELARKEGIKEVVDWIKKEFGYYLDKGKLEKIIIDDNGYFGQAGSIKKWQTKLKEWEVSDNGK